MVAMVALALFALSSLTHARAGPDKHKAVTHQVAMVNDNQIGEQPSMMVTPACYTTSQFEITARAGLRRARSAQHNGRSPTILHRQRQQPAVVQLE